MNQRVRLNTPGYFIERFLTTALPRVNVPRTVPESVLELICWLFILPIFKWGFKNGIHQYTLR